MANTKGRDLLLKIEQPADSGTYIYIGGLTSLSWTIANESVDATDKFSNGVRELVEGAGTQTHSISADFWPKDSVSDDLVWGISHLNQQRRIKIITGGTTDYTGLFDFTSYERSGAYADIEGGALSLENNNGLTEVSPLVSTSLEYGVFVFNV